LKKNVGNGRAIADIDAAEAIPRMPLRRSERRKITGIGQPVDDEHLVSSPTDEMSDQRRSDKAGSAGVIFIYTSCAIIRVPKSLMPRTAGRTQTDWRSPSSPSTVAFIKTMAVVLGPLSFTVRPYSIAKSHTARVATWQRPHPYVGSHGTAAPQQYGCWNAGAALSDLHCARASPIEQKSVPGPEVG
jgi:hypothetical protein